MTNPVLYLNTVLGTGIITVLVFLDYIKRFQTEKFQKILFLAVLLIGIPAIAADFLCISTGYPGLNAGKIILIADSVLLCIISLFLASRHSSQTNIRLIFLFSMLTGWVAILDLFINTGGLVWLFFTTAMLCAYFYIIRLESKIDSLTGIGNRYSFNEFIETLSKRNKKRKIFKESWAVVMIDMDHFKEINDKYGHLEGDNALKDMAKIIKGCIRRSDFAARYGGDEFVLATRAESDIEKLIARLRKTLDLHNETAGRPYKLQISYGCDIFTTGGERTINEFLNHVDNLMYKHKAERRRVSDRVDSETAKEPAGPG